MIMIDNFFQSPISLKLTYSTDVMISGRSRKYTWSIRSRKSGQIGYIKSHVWPNFGYVQLFSTFFHSEKSFRLNDVRKRSVEILIQSDDFLGFLSHLSHGSTPNLLLKLTLNIFEFPRALIMYPNTHKRRISLFNFFRPFSIVKNHFV